MIDARAPARLALNFTPLEFKTKRWAKSFIKAGKLNFTPLEFKTIADKPISEFVSG